MPRPPQDITDAELAVLQLLWDAPRRSIRQLADQLYPGGSASHYATVQKLLERLEAKRAVRRVRSASPVLFEPAIAREELIGRRLRSLADQLCGGSLTPLLTHLVSTEPLSPTDLASLRTLLEQSRAGKRKRGD
jgi:BlaI family transcriptional regulator, penicillinase repressor